MPSYEVLKYGHVVEVKEFVHGHVARDYETFERSYYDENGEYKAGRDKEGKEERKMEYRNSVNHKAREKIRRLVSANFGEGDLFITITFKENITDIEFANKELQKFIKRLRRRKPTLKYVGVIEFQKRGAVHYHVVCDLDITWKDIPEKQLKERELGELWGNGFINITDIKHVDNVGAYLVKYMSKQSYDDRLEGKKRYFFRIPVSNL